MRIIFMGTPEFAVPSLDILIKNNYNVVAVVTATDKMAGRGKQITMSAVKKYALEQNIPILQPEKLKSEEFLAELQALKADLQIVVAFRMLPEAVWNMPPLGTFNLHASLLPQFRGAAPINWAIISGEKQTGVTTFFLQQEIDTGDLILQEKIDILDEDNFETLYNKLMNKGSDLVLKTVQMIENKNITPQKQIVDGITLLPAPKIFRETCEINFNQSSIEVWNFVRGLSPIPAAWTMINGKLLKIFSVKPFQNTDQNLEVGSFQTDHKHFLHFITADGYISVEELQIESRKRLTIEEFLRGNPFK